MATPDQYIEFQSDLSSFVRDATLFSRYNDQLIFPHKVLILDKPFPHSKEVSKSHLIGYYFAIFDPTAETVQNGEYKFAQALNPKMIETLFHLIPEQDEYFKLQFIEKITKNYAPLLHPWFATQLISEISVQSDVNYFVPVINSARKFYKNLRKQMENGNKKDRFKVHTQNDPIVDLLYAKAKKLSKEINNKN